MGVATAVALLVIALGEKHEKLGRWKWHLAVFVEGVAVLLSIYASIATESDSPATKHNLESAHDSISRQLENLRGLILSGDSARARELAEQVLDKQLMRTALDTGLVQIGLGKYEIAITHLEYASRAAKDDSGRAIVMTVQSVAWGLLAEELIQRDLLDSAKVLYRQVLDYCDGVLELRRDDHETWNNRGNAQSRLGLYDSAKASYDSALYYKPDFREAWRNKALSLSYGGDLVAASASCDSAMKYSLTEDHFYLMTLLFQEWLHDSIAASTQ